MSGLHDCVYVCFMYPEHVSKLSGVNWLLFLRESWSTWERRVGHIALLYVTVTCVSAHVLTVHRHRGSFFRKPNEAHVSVSLTRLMSLPCMRILYVLVYVICVCEWFYKIHFCKCSNGPVRTNAQIHRWLVFEAAVPRTHKWACRNAQAHRRSSCHTHYLFV